MKATTTNNALISYKFEGYIQEKYKSKTFNEELFFDFRNFDYRLDEKEFWIEWEKLSNLYKEVREWILENEKKKMAEDFK